MYGISYFSPGKPLYTSSQYPARVSVFPPYACRTRSFSPRFRRALVLKALTRTPAIRGACVVHEFPESDGNLACEPLLPGPYVYTLRCHACKMFLLVSQPRVWRNDVTRAARLTMLVSQSKTQAVGSETELSPAHPGSSCLYVVSDNRSMLARWASALRLIAQTFQV